MVRKRKTARIEASNMTKSNEKKQIFSLYERLIALSNFASLNKMGFEQIINAFNEEFEFGPNKSAKIKLNCSLDFIEYSQCSQTMNDLVKLYSEQYENGDT